MVGRGEVGFGEGEEGRDSEDELRGLVRSACRCDCSVWLCWRSGRCAERLVREQERIDEDDAPSDRPRSLTKLSKEL